MMSGMKFIRRNGIKALLVLVGISLMGIVAQRYLAASPSEPTKVDFRPGVEVDHPHRAAVVQRLETNATLEAFEDTDLFAKVSGYLSDVRVDIGDHVKAGQVLAVIDIPELEHQLAEVGCPADQGQQRVDKRRDELLDQAAELRADHDRDRELDQVPAHYEVLEATHGTTFPADANEPCADAGRGRRGYACRFLSRPFTSRCRAR